ncbi:MAG TPA: fluoride efflux transporter CrcB [Candidatus Saccharimonadales bacterium]|nr:fluoride efflux transporter CrcB [Candidatus Saccharimonadales bacterium]
MQRLLIVGLGGCLGTMARYLLGGLMVRAKQGATFPLETLAVNVLGCLAIGFLSELAEARGLFSGATRAFLFIGVLGGFTTFSSFGYETFQLLRDGEAGAALGSVGLQLGLGLGAVWAGHVAGRLLGGA